MVHVVEKGLSVSVAGLDVVDSRISIGVKGLTVGESSREHGLGEINGGNEKEANNRTSNVEDRQEGIRHGRQIVKSWRFREISYVHRQQFAFVFRVKARSELKVIE